MICARCLYFNIYNREPAIVIIAGNSLCIKHATEKVHLLTDAPPIIMVRKTPEDLDMA